MPSVSEAPELWLEVDGVVDGVEDEGGVADELPLGAGVGLDAAGADCELLAVEDL